MKFSIFLISSISVCSIGFSSLPEKAGSVYELSWNGWLNPSFLCSPSGSAVVKSVFYHHTTGSSGTKAPVARCTCVILEFWESSVATVVPRVDAPTATLWLWNTQLTNKLATVRKLKAVSFLHGLFLFWSAKVQKRYPWADIKMSGGLAPRGSQEIHSSIF